MAESQNTVEHRVDVLIGGAGFAGLALALALRQALGETFRVAVADPVLGRPIEDARASAIAAAARRMFEAIGVWDAGAARAVCGGRWGWGPRSGRARSRSSTWRSPIRSSTTRCVRCSSRSAATSRR